ncbi:MAG: hypothetical protein OQK32_05650 [Gammaproteobacteria bacterium]|nr:hypothetical protein [Gammaproteobacteria bacterium]
MISDRDGQPPIAIHYRRNIAKALESLRGICLGITVDRRLNEDEVVMLDTWLRDQQFLQNEPDVFDLLDLTGDILADGVVTNEELEDLIGLIDTVLEHGLDSSEYFMDDQVERLLGYTKGLIADNHLSDQEVNQLGQWVREARQQCNTWPVSVVADRVDAILADNIIDEEEREDLLQLLQSLHGGDWMESGAVSGVSAELPWDQVDNVGFTGKMFCITGKFVYGPRRRVCERIESLGGLIHARVVSKLDYLVVGAIASRDWKHSTHGNKIREAMAMRDDGRGIKIITEWQLAEHI